MKIKPMVVLGIVSGICGFTFKLSAQQPAQQPVEAAQQKEKVEDEFTLKEIENFAQAYASRSKMIDPQEKDMSVIDRVVYSDLRQAHKTGGRAFAMLEKCVKERNLLRKELS